MSNTIKILAFYLPQFHAIPENDEWWGKGFTEWVNVRKGKAHSKGQEQPRVPLNNNYYDLSNPQTLEWQASLMNKYNIFGMCFYHYWFNGKMLLEKPAEILLNNVQIHMRFCFSWANEPWSRTWSGNATQVLMPQSYGDHNDWVEHFNYLLPFFKDDRYIKVGNRPMFFIYKTKSIPCCKEMMDLWIELAQNNGFAGIHFVETLRDGSCDNRNLPISARAEFEPSRTNSQRNWFAINYGRIRRRFHYLLNFIFKTSIPGDKPYKYNEFVSRSLSLKSPEGTYGGCLVGWDNSARRGLKSTVILPATKNEFKYYLKSKIKITLEEYKTDIICINAWNEWAEGTYLEPDTIHKYEYLEVIKELTEDK